MADKLLQAPHTLKCGRFTPQLLSKIFETVPVEVRFISKYNPTRDYQSLITFCYCEDNESNFSRVGGTFYM